MLAALLLLAALPEPVTPPRQFALTISGGVSLGAYEGGLTWALVKYLRWNSGRPVTLAGVTGASAGSINALLAAALWCQEDGELQNSTLDDNVLREAWLSVGLDQLLPDSNRSFEESDVLFRAAPLEETFARMERRLFGPSAARYRPGCSVPVGITVTRLRPVFKPTSDLRAGSQRFVIAWRFEVDRAGRAHIVRADLKEDSDSAASLLQLAETRGELDPLQVGNALLASSAFPFAFRPRLLCECALECPAEDVVKDGVCPGPEASMKLSGLSCSEIAPHGKRTLCRRAYVDGGIFDNVPLGLAIDLVEEHAPRTPLQSIVYLVVDPDVRHLAPREAAAPESNAALALDPIELFSNLVESARTAALGRAIHLARWQNDARNILDRAAVLFDDFARLQAEVVRVAGGDPPTPAESLANLLRLPRRDRLARFLIDCSRLDAADHECAERLRTDAQRGLVGEGLNPSPAELRDLVHRIRVSLDAVNARRRAPLPATLAGRLQLLERMLDGVLLLAADFRFLQGDVDRVQGALSAAELEQMREDLIASISYSRMIAESTRILLSSLAAAVALEDLQQDAAIAGIVNRLLGDRPSPLDQELPEDLLAGAGTDRLRALVAASKRLEGLGGRADELARAASDLSDGRQAERTLVLSRRFLPLASAALFNFSGFLDRKLRELDFNLGAYDMAMQIADFRCRTRDPYDPKRPPPPARLDAPWELDPRNIETQRCLGEELRDVARVLGLDHAAHALPVFATAARVQVAVSLGSGARAEELLREPAWAWLQRASRPHLRDDLDVALSVLTAERVPCEPGAPEPLCPGEIAFEDLVRRLRASGFRPSDGTLSAVFDDPDRWIIAFSRRLVDRGLTGASNQSLKAADAVLFGMRAAELVLRREEQGRGIRFVLDGSSIPFGPARPDRSAIGSVLAHALPYRIGVEVIDGGLTLSWLEPSVRFGSLLSLQSVLDVVDLHGWHGATTLGLLPSFDLAGNALSFGPRWTIPWDHAPSSPGLQGRLSVLQERLAIATGLRSVSAGQRGWFLTLSVSDLNGLAYWLSPWSR